MIRPDSVALRFETRPTATGRAGLRCRAVLVLAVRDLGALGCFALVATGEADKRFFARHHEAEAEAVDVRELISIDAFEKISAGPAVVPHFQTRAA